MKPIRFLVIAVTAFLLIYALLPHAGAGYNLMFSLFLVGNFLVLLLVFRVLKFGIAPKEKFDDGYWYSDVDKQYGLDNKVKEQ